MRYNFHFKKIKSIWKSFQQALQISQGISTRIEADWCENDNILTFLNIQQCITI